MTRTRWRAATPLPKRWREWQAPIRPRRDPPADAAELPQHATPEPVDRDQERDE
ncbi:hypothetical protein ABIE65_001394 [Constrictibacter sp. MBR-5]|jgi:hypothetical protein|uniref:hypothetical protein n=1 Tax=Constrictibacter sp. MBR-5 TaxID=3156467 RepID=UPI0033958D27